MSLRILLLPAVFLSLTLPAQDAAKTVEQFVSEIDEKLPVLLHEFNCPGSALAIIENGEVILQSGYGLANVENGIEVSTQTGFNIGSISKTVAAFGFMKLVQEGKIDLDAPAEKYLTRWHLPESEFDASEVTIRRLLSHTAGLSLHGYPGWSPSDTLPTIEQSLNGVNNGPGRVEIIFEPGSRYKYSGGGISIMQLIVEEVTGLKFEDYMEQEVLKPLGMHNSSYRIDEGILAASASEYDRYGGQIDFELFTAQAAAGFHTTIEDFTRFAMACMYKNTDHPSHGKVLNADMLELMMECVPEACGRFGYGLGFMIEQYPGSELMLAGHRGANAGWQAIFNVNPETNDGFVMVTNGGAGQDIYHPVFADWMHWKDGPKLEGWYNSKPPISAAIKAAITKDGVDAAAPTYAALKASHPDKYNFDEEQLNLLGYHYMNTGNIEEAKAVLELNMELFPKSWNVYDSYAEVLLHLDRKAQAIELYKRSVAMNPGNVGGIAFLEDNGIDTEALFYKMTKSQLKAFEGTYVQTNGGGDGTGAWTLVFEVNRGKLMGRDGDRVLQIYPVGHNAFVLENGASIIFDDSHPEQLTFVFGGQEEFERLK